MKTTIKSLSSERLEQEIAKIYWLAATENPPIHPVETGLLAELWSEFDYRIGEGLIDQDPDTGSEPDYD